MSPLTQSRRVVPRSRSEAAYGRARIGSRRPSAGGTKRSSAVSISPRSARVSGTVFNFATVCAGTLEKWFPKVWPRGTNAIRSATTAAAPTTMPSRSRRRRMRAEDGSRCTRSWCRVVVPTAQVVRLAVQREHDALALGAAADLAEGDLGVRRDRREQLVVVAEAEVGDGRTLRTANVLELDLDSAAGAGREVGGVDREAVGDIEHRGGRLGEQHALFDTERRPDEAALAERGAGRSEGAGDDEAVAGLRSATPGHAGRAAERGDAQEEPLGARRVAADNRN